MKNIINRLNREFENRLRLGIMSILVVNSWVDFITLKYHLEATDGNLASHIQALEKAGYLEIRKQFIGRKPNTSFRITPAGRKAFTKHLDALEDMILRKKNDK